MSDLRPFKDVQLQWLRLLVQDKCLSARAIQLAVYLAIVRYNHRNGKAWPSQQTICNDLGIDSTRTVSRVSKELKGKWLDIAPGRGASNSCVYRPSAASLRAASDLRKSEESTKDKIVTFPLIESGQNCPSTKAGMSAGPRQKCLTNKEKEQKKKKETDPLQLRFVLGGDFVAARKWNDSLEISGFDKLDRLVEPVQDEMGRIGYMLPADFPAPVSSHIWLLQLESVLQLAGKDLPHWLCAALASKRDAS